MWIITRSLLLSLLLAGTASAQVVTGGSGGGGPAQTQFNVKTFGAFGDGQSSVNASINASTLTCTDCNFTSAIDVGKTAFCSNNTSQEAFNTLATITSVTNSTTAVVNQSTNFNGACTLRWGHLDDTAVTSAVTAALAVVFGKTNQNGRLGSSTLAPVIYLPAGGYLMCASLLNTSINLNGTGAGVTVQGDGADATYLIAGGGTPCPTQNNNLGMLFNSSMSNVVVRGITFDGGNCIPTTTSQNVSVGSGGLTKFENVRVVRWGPNSTANNGILASGIIYLDRVDILNNGAGFSCQTCQGEAHFTGSSNNGNGFNLQFFKVVGSNTSTGFRWFGGQTDECGTLTTGCVKLVASNDVWLIGLMSFSTNSGIALSVDADSFGHMSGGIIGTFGNDTNATGLSIAAGGTLQASDVRFIGSGTGKCINNSGQLNDNGGNSCESMFPITSGASAGTTATLTVTTLGAAPTANCSVGDSILVEGVNVAGYNGYFSGAVTATGATTIAYTTVGSNIGAGAGGVAHCRNLQTYTGTLPKALLNNPIPNTCYYTITPIANATTVTLCNFKLGSATNITAIKASSQATTTCATPPLITITDGTVSQTLTLTSGKSSWDSSVDTSTGVGATIFKAGGTITVKYDVAANSACATPATNLGVSYNISPILSN